jgi:hypothetical protein
MPGSLRNTGAAGNLSGATASNTPLVVNADTKVGVHVAQVNWLSSVAGTFVVKTTAGVVLRRYPVPANGGGQFSAPPGEALFSTPAGQGVVFDSPTSITGGLHLLYWTE